MKAEQFKQLIRAIVQEEIKKSLPTLVPQIVAEALAGKTVKPKNTDSKVEPVSINIRNGNGVPGGFYGKNSRKLNK